MQGSYLDPYLMRVFTDEGVQDLDVPDRDERTTVGNHWNAIKGFLGDGSTDRLYPFEDQSVAGHRLQTDPSEIEIWAYRGELDFEDIYTP